MCSLQTIFKTGPVATMKAIAAEGDRVALEAESDADLVSGGHYHNYHFLFLIRRTGREAKEYLDPNTWPTRLRLAVHGCRALTA
jgi:hypothetical protein